MMVRLIGLFCCNTASPPPQITPAIMQRGIFYKQKAAGFYPTSCVVIAETMVNTSLTVSADWCWLLLLYMFLLL